MKIKILESGCRSGGVEHGPGAVVDLKEIPPLWEGKAKIVAAPKPRQEPKKDK